MCYREEDKKNMMGIKSIIVFVVLVGCINVATCAVAQSFPQTHPDHPGKCWDEDTNTAYNPGDEYSPKGSCSKVSCYSDFSFGYESCGVKSINDPSCKRIDHDLSLPYPDCCVAYECTDANGKVRRF